MPSLDVRLLIVGDSPLARAGLAALLGTQAELVIVGQVAPDADLSASLPIYSPDVLVWDLGWDTQRGLELVADAAEAAPPVLVLLADDSRAADALSAGAHGVLRQDAGPDALAAAAKAVSQDLIVLASELLPSIAAPAAEDLTPPADALTPREIEVLTLLAEGLANKAIAARLSISEHTVKFHVNAVMNKLGAQSRTEAVVRATRLGLIVL